MKFYRYEKMAGSDKLTLTEFSLVKETPKGYWICQGHPNMLHSFHKWVSKTGKKRHAYPTKEEALNNLIKRTELRIKILSNQLTASKMLLKDAQYINDKIIEEKLQNFN